MRPPPAGRVGVRHFAADTPAVREARRYAADLARAWDLGNVADTTELLVGELAANAVAASPHPGGQATPAAGARGRIALRLTCTDTAVVVEVWDGDAAATPVRRAQDVDAEGGRGLLLVEALSQDRGFYRPAGGGKVVWCALPLAGPPLPCADGQACPLPRRDAGAATVPDPEPGRPVEIDEDLPLLQRVLDGLRALDTWHLPGADGRRTAGGSRGRLRASGFRRLPGTDGGPP
jgi:hypothetical protein